MIPASTRCAPAAAAAGSSMPRTAAAWRSSQRAPMTATASASSGAGCGSAPMRRMTLRAKARGAGLRDVRAAPDLRDELGQEERVATRRLVAGAAEAVVGLAEPVAHERGDGVGPERLEQPAVGLRAGGDAVQEVARRPVARGARGQDDEDPDVARTRAQVGQPLQRREVGPVRVVDEQRERPLQGDVRGEPEEAVQPPRRRGALEGLRELGRLLAPQSQDGPGERRGAGEELLALGLVGEEHAAFDELAHDAERVRGLELAAACGEAGDALLARAAAHPLEQRGLADPGRPLERDDAALAVDDRIEGRACEVELRVTVVQLLHRWASSSASICRASSRALARRELSTRFRCGTSTEVDPSGAWEGGSQRGSHRPRAVGWRGAGRL